MQDDEDAVARLMAPTQMSEGEDQDRDGDDDGDEDEDEGEGAAGGKSRSAAKQPGMPCRSNSHVGNQQRPAVIAAEGSPEPDMPTHDGWEQAGGFVDDDTTAEDAQQCEMTAAAHVDVIALYDDDDPPYCQQQAPAMINLVDLTDTSAEVQQLADQAFALLAGRLLVCPVPLQDW
jgi:hypothetical protein